LLIIAMLFVPVSQSPDFSRLRPDPKAANQVFRDTRWPELLPPGWDPDSQLKALQKGVRLLADDGPQAQARQQQIRAIWDNAPVNPAMNGAAVRIPGYVVPTEVSIYGMREFLLVPYFGACIHSPPPPSNQIIHVWSAKPRKDLHSMSEVWVSGKLSTERSESGMGPSGYRLDLTDVQAYKVAH
jgi:hypothetical protein